MITKDFLQSSVKVREEPTKINVGNEVLEIYINKAHKMVKDVWRLVVSTWTPAPENNLLTYSVSGCFIKKPKQNYWFLFEQIAERYSKKENVNPSVLRVIKLLSRCNI